MITVHHVGTRTTSAGLILAALGVLSGLSIVAGAWEVRIGVPTDGPELRAGGTRTAARWEQALSAPGELVCHLRLPRERDSASFTLTAADAAHAAVQFRLLRRAGNQITISGQADGRPLAMTTCTARGWSRPDPSGSTTVGWRFNTVSNLWDDRDRAEIGSAYARITPFDEKVFALRFVLGARSRQVWLDDRMVAEHVVGTVGEMALEADLRGMAVVAAVGLRPVRDEGRFVALSLADYGTAGEIAATSPRVEHAFGDAAVPFRPLAAPGVDLSRATYRYRLTHGSGPNAPYVNGLRAWPSPLQIDPDRFAVRVPHRDYQNVYLLAWLDEKPNQVPGGTLRFFREQAGHCASTRFAITPAALAAGDVQATGRRTADGKTLYVVRVPVDTIGLFGFKDMADQFLDLEITKPVSLGRSYPDPIYYGEHPAGRPSSVRIVGITLEEAPFGYDVTPGQFGYVFEQPEAPRFTFTVRNHTGTAFAANITVNTRSYDSEEVQTITQSVRVAGESVAADIVLDGTERLGWHQMQVTVTGSGVRRSNTLSFVLLPPNTRTYGKAPNETRFGAWTLWGHHAGFRAGDLVYNERILAMLRRIGIRAVGYHSSFVDATLAKKYDMLPTGPHTIVSV